MPDRYFCPEWVSAAKAGNQQLSVFVSSQLDVHEAGGTLAGVGDVLELIEYQGDGLDCDEFGMGIMDRTFSTAVLRWAA